MKKSTKKSRKARRTVRNDFTWSFSLDGELAMPDKLEEIRGDAMEALMEERTFDEDSTDYIVIYELVPRYKLSDSGIKIESVK